MLASLRETNLPSEVSGLAHRVLQVPEFRVGSGTGQALSPSAGAFESAACLPRSSDRCFSLGTLVFMMGRPREAPTLCPSREGARNEKMSARQRWQ